MKGITGDNTQLVLDSSFGLAGQVGFNYAIDTNWAVHAAATYIDIDTDVSIIPGNGSTTIETTVAIDPWVMMLGASFAF